MKKWLFLLAFLQVISTLMAQTQVTSIISDERDGSSDPKGFVSFNNTFLFNATTRFNGREIWISDGTSNNTKILKDINPGPANGATVNLNKASVVLDNKFYFIADDGQNGKQIWSTDGTEQSTTMISNLPDLNATELTLVGDYIFFLTKTGDNLELWRSDGSREGTIMVKGDMPIWNTPSFQGSTNGLFFFTFQPQGVNESRLWRSDGTEQGTFPLTGEMEAFGVILEEGGSSAFTQYISYKDELYLVARSEELFPYPETIGILKTDGTIENTIPIKAVYAENQNALELAHVIEVNNKLYFFFYEGDTYHQFIWESDGTEAGTHKIYDEKGFRFYQGSNLSSFENDLLFTGKGNNDETVLLRLNTNDYSVEVVKMLAENLEHPGIYFQPFANKITKLNQSLFHISTAIEPWKREEWFIDLSNGKAYQYDEQIYPHDFFSFQNEIFFAGSDEFEDRELWKVNGAVPSTDLFLNINQAKSGMLFDNLIATVQDKAFFLTTDSINRVELWSYDEQTKETSLLKKFDQESRLLANSFFSKLNDNLCFLIASSSDTLQIWRSDGTIEGTEMIDEVEGYIHFIYNKFLVTDQQIFFSVIYDVNLIRDKGTILYSTNGEEVQPVISLGHNEYNIAFQVHEMASSENAIYYTTSGAGNPLWKSNGTEQNTDSITHFYSANYLTTVGEKAFLSARKTKDDEIELWVSDGTEAGTVQVKDIGLGYSSEPADLTSFNGKLVFTAYTEDAGREYWITDGTSEGTFQLTNIEADKESVHINSGYAILNGELYFAANSKNEGPELWKTNGTTAGTTLVKDVNQGPQGSFPKHFFADEELLYFSAFTEEDGFELWSSDGTSGGTQLVYDFLAGPLSSSPSNLMLINNEIFLLAETAQAGRQLWNLEKELVTSISEIERNDPFQVFPNPTSDYLNFSHVAQKIQQIKVLNLQGREMLSSKDISNQIYVGSLPPGIYLLMMEFDQKHIVKKFVKSR